MTIVWLSLFTLIQVLSIFLADDIRWLWTSALTMLLGAPEVELKLILGQVADQTVCVTRHGSGTTLDTDRHITFLNESAVMLRERKVRERARNLCRVVWRSDWSLVNPTSLIQSVCSTKAGAFVCAIICEPSSPPCRRTAYSLEKKIFMWTQVTRALECFLRTYLCFRLPRQ